METKEMIFQVKVIVPKEFVENEETRKIMVSSLEIDFDSPEVKLLEVNY